MNTHQIWSFTGETALMIIVDSFDYTKVHAWNPIDVQKFVLRVQKAMDLAPRNAVKLNRALPIKQGVGKDVRPKFCVHCKATPATPRMQMRIRANMNVHWVGAPHLGIDALLCHLCDSCERNTGSLPSEARIARWEVITSRVSTGSLGSGLGFSPPPSNIDRSMCSLCHHLSSEYRIVWIAPLQKMLCDMCTRQNIGEYLQRVNEARDKYGLGALEELYCSNPRCKKLTTPGDRRNFNGRVYCKACGQFAQNHDGENRQTVAGNVLKGVPKPRRPKGKPPATQCEVCGTRVPGFQNGLFKWSANAKMDTCFECRKKYHFNNEKAATQYGTGGYRSGPRMPPT